MTQWRNAPGQIDPPVVYFENARGYLIVAPDVSHPTPQGYERKECKYLHEVDKLTKRMNQQDQDQFAHLMQKDQEIMRQRREKTRSNLRQRMLAHDCSPFERRFIQGALQYLDRKEKENTEFKIRGYFQAREFDSSSGGVEDYGKQVQPAKMSDRLAALLTK